MIAGSVKAGRREGCCAAFIANPATRSFLLASRAEMMRARN